MNPSQPLPDGNDAKPDSIFAVIRAEADQFLYNFISPVPGYAFNQYQTLKRIFLYLSNRYENAAYYLDREKLFFNIVTPAVEVATKMISIDTKDIRLIAQNNSSYFPTYLLEKELRQWLKKSEMGRILHQIAEEAPRFGSVLLEKTKDGARVCDLRRTMLDTSVDRAKESRFITTIHYMSDVDMRAATSQGWDADAIELAIQRFATTQAAQPFEDQTGNLNIMRSSPQVKVYKRHGEVPLFWVDPKVTGAAGDKMVKAIFIVAGPDFLQRNVAGTKPTELGVVLFKSKWRGDWPFKDFHYHKIKGRWLGLGVVEMLFDIQTRVNEIKNQKRVSMELSTMHLFQTKDKTITRNVLTDLQNGDILVSPTGIEPIANEERNLEAFDSEEESYSQQVDKLTFAYEAIRGETAPGTTALGQTQIAVAQASGVYLFKRENLSIFLQSFFNDLVLPQLVKDLTPEHIMRFTGSAQEIDKLDAAAAELYANEVIVKEAMAGRVPTPQLQEAARQKALMTYRKTGANRFLKIVENFYDDASFDFDFNIDNEQIDPQAILDGVQTLFGFLQNPAVLQDPRLKLLFYQAAEAMGISPGEMELADQQATAMQQNGQLPTGLPANGAKPGQPAPVQPGAAAPAAAQGANQ